MDFPMNYILSSDEDEDIADFLLHERRPYTVRPRMDNFEKWDDHDFVTRFRLRKDTVLEVLALIENQLEFPTDRNHAIRPIDQLLLTLRFFATGKFVISSGDFVNVSKSSASKIIKRVSFAIASLAPKFIKMPDTAEKISEAQQSFFARARMPRVIGSIDGTNVSILSPGGPHAETFRNRKGFFSLNVQTVSSTNLKTLDIVARWPGSAHDQYIFNNSWLKTRFETGEFGNTLLVADSGYTNTRYVVTPLLNTGNPVEELYNESIIRTRNPVERQYGVWKRRFPVLSLKLRLKLETTMAVIVATAVLHNIAIHEKEELPPQEPNIIGQNIDYDYDWQEDPIEEDQVRNARTQLIDNYFTTLLNQ